MHRTVARFDRHSPALSTKRPLAGGSGLPGDGGDVGAAGVVSVKVAALREGVVKTMLVYKLKAALSVVLASIVTRLSRGLSFHLYFAVAHRRELVGG